MIGIVIVSHGQLAREFRAALEHVVGPQQQLATVAIGPDECGEPCRQTIRRVLRDDATAVDDHHPIADLLSFREDVSREDDRVVASELRDHLPDLTDLAWIETDRGLVQDDHVGVVQQCLSDTDALPETL